MRIRVANSNERFKELENPFYELSANYSLLIKINNHYK